ncbi:amino acid ABC transporter substrate-binding protein [Candidatus Pacearchaeota archaeon]|nr:amino acid ABC transporter substrate-binding protein [Candidatus Pacearchaeota archaeon]
MKNKELVIAIVVLVVVVVVIGLFVVYSNGNSDEDVIKIGVVSTLTGFGASWGDDIIKGIDLAVKEINTGGGIKGKKIKVIYEDMGEVDLSAAASAARKFVSVDDVDVILTQWAEDTSVVWPIATENNIVTINIASGADDIPRSDPLVFMIRPLSSEFTEKIIDYAISEGYENPVIISEQNAYFTNLGDVTNGIWEEKTGKKMKRYEVITFERDYKTQMTKIKDEGNDAIFLQITQNIVPAALKDIEELNLNIQIFGYVGIDDDLVIEASGESIEGLIYTDFEDSDPEFIEKFNNEYGHDPVVAADLAYDAIKIIEVSYKSNEISTEGLVKGLHNIQNYSAASGLITIDENGARVGDNFVLKVISDGEGVLIDGE